MIAYCSNCLISGPGWLASIAEGNSILIATSHYFTLPVYCQSPTDNDMHDVNHSLSQHAHLIFIALSISLDIINWMFVLNFGPLLREIKALLSLCSIVGLYLAVHSE